MGSIPTDGQVLDAYASGKPIQECSVALGISKPSIFKRLKAMVRRGVVTQKFIDNMRRHPISVKAVRHPEISDSSILNLYINKGLGMKPIADHFGVNLRTISGRLGKYGVIRTEDKSGKKHRRKKVSIKTLLKKFCKKAKCEWCSSLFVPMQKTQIFCSRRCAKLDKQRRYKVPCHTRTCPQCKKKFKQTNARQEYCSKECVNTYRSTGRITKLQTIPDKTLRKFAPKSAGLHSLLLMLELTSTTANRKGLQRRLRSLKITDDVFMKRDRDLPLSKVLVKNSPWTGDSQSLLIRLVNNGIKKYQCEECRQKPWFNNKPLIMELHHVNKNRSDNHLENLRALCPYCHTQAHGKGTRAHKELA